ncbi:MAG: VCBS repeat-containing protein [Candidatus Cloacimonetes bacterium]|nr:VCBS repeat-containing protein [Candidatus Cloacimonadota bacterium]
MKQITKNIILLLLLSCVHFAIDYQKFTSSNIILPEGQKTVYTAWGDFDLDGDLDAYIVNDGAPNELFMNNYCGHFAPNTPCKSYGEQERTKNTVDVGDDRTLGFTKLTHTSFPKLVRLKDGVASSKSAEWVDFDEDGDLDLYVVNDGLNRLFINDLFSPTRKYDPFSEQSVVQQANLQSSQDYLFHTKEVTGLPTSGYKTVINVTTVNVNTPFDANGVFTDTTQKFISSTPSVTPGMYIELNQSENQRFVILDVLSETTLRIGIADEVIDASSIVNSYTIVEDSFSSLEDLGVLENSLVRVAGPITDPLLYQTAVTYTDSLTNSQITSGDQLIMYRSSGATLKETLVNIDGRVTKKNINVTPAPRITDDLGADLLLESDFKTRIRRKNGEIVFQKFLRDLTIDFNSQSLLSGDQIQILDKKYACPKEPGKIYDQDACNVYAIESVSQEGIIFLSGTDLVKNLGTDVPYEVIRRSASARTQRYFEDKSANFSINTSSFDAVAYAATAQYKKGDHIVLDPVVDGFGTNSFNSNQIVAVNQNRAQFGKGILGITPTVARPSGRLQVLDIVSPTRLLVDAFPSEVSNLKDSDFPYQMRSMFGRLSERTNLDGTIQIFEELSLENPKTKQFDSTLGFMITQQDRAPVPPQILAFFATELRAINLNLNTFLTETDTFSNTSNYKIQIDDPGVPLVQAITNVEYRPLYYGISANPYVAVGEQRKKIRVFNRLPKGVAVGHYFVFSNNYKTKKQIVRIEPSASGNLVDLTLESEPLADFFTELETACTNTPGLACTAGDEDTQAFFDTAPRVTSTAYEFIATSTFAVNGDKTVPTVFSETLMVANNFKFTDLNVASGDLLEFFETSVDRLNTATGKLYTAEVLRVESNGSEANAVVLSSINGAVAPFNNDYDFAKLGFKPIYKGKLLEDQEVEYQNASFDFTKKTNSSKSDLLSIFYPTPEGYRLATRVPIDTVTPTKMTLSFTLKSHFNRDSDLTDALYNSIDKDNFYFRITPVSGKLQSSPTFIDRRQGMDFSKLLPLSSEDDTVRGAVLLDVFTQSFSLTNQSFFKRFRLKSLISKNVIELTSMKRGEDEGSSYFYELKKLKREAGKNVSTGLDYLENDTGNGVSITSGDFNSDGRRDFYLLNRFNDTKASNNESFLMLGSKTLESSTRPKDGYILKKPSSSFTTSSKEIANRSAKANSTEYFLGSQAKAVSLGEDRASDLFILNNKGPERLFVSKQLGEGLQNNVSTLFHINGTESEGTLAGLDPTNNTDSTENRDILVGDLNNDSYDDFYYVNTSQKNDGKTANTVLVDQVNELYTFGGNTFTEVKAADLPPDTEMSKGDGVSGQIIDFDNDSYNDIAVLNKDKPYFYDIHLEKQKSIGGSLTPLACGTSADGLNRHIQFMDLNMDGYLDYYVSRGGSKVATNELCIATKPTNDTNNYFVFDLIPRNFATDSTKTLLEGLLTIQGKFENPDKVGNFVDKTFTRRFKYQYPHVQRIKIGTGIIKEVKVNVNWSNRAVYDYFKGDFIKSSNTTGSPVYRLEQPDILAIVETKKLFAGSTSPLAIKTQVIGIQTTNIEGMGISIIGGYREDVILDNMRVFFTGQIQKMLLSGETVGETQLIQPVANNSIKLYLDQSALNPLPNSPQWRPGEPDGKFDPSTDVLLATTSISRLTNDGRYVGDSAATVGEEASVLNQGLFSDISYLSVDAQGAVTRQKLLIKRQDLRDQKTPLQEARNRLGLLVVYTIDIPAEQKSVYDKIAQTQLVLPLKVGDEKIAEVNGLETPTDRLAFIQQSDNVQVDINLLGTSSNLVHKVKYIDDNSLLFKALSETASDIASQELNAEKITFQEGKIGDIVANNVEVDVVPPITPVLNANIAGVSFPTKTVVIGGNKEAPSRLLIQNLDNQSSEQSTSALSNSLETWSFTASNLIEGENRFVIHAVDQYGNKTLDENALRFSIFVDTTAPIASKMLVTNIGINQAKFSFETNENASGYVAVTAQAGGNYIGTPQEQRKYTFGAAQRQHSIDFGIENQEFCGVLDQGQNAPPALYQVTTLCGGTEYKVAIYVEDRLGNGTSPIIQIPSLRFKTPSKNTLLQDLDGEGDLDLDSDSDGLPDYLEEAPNYPDLDKYNANDALLDFDDDGVNNVEEYRLCILNRDPNDATPCAFDMYNSFDQLPIPNAGNDVIDANPGVLVLDASKTVKNGFEAKDLTYIWEMQSTPTSTVQTLVAPVVNAPNKEKTFFNAKRAGDYVVSLRIFTNRGVVTQKDTVLYRVKNLAPESDAGVSKTGTVNFQIPLDGRGTYDANEDLITYQWIQVSGPSLEEQKLVSSELGVKSETSPATFFVTRSTGKYVFELIAADDLGAVGRDQVTVYVNSENDRFPIANAGFDRVVTVDSEFQLSGDLSSAMNATNGINYYWSPINANSLAVAERCRVECPISDTKCKPNVFSNQTASPFVNVSESILNRVNPTVKYTEPGLYAMNLIIEAVGKGLRSESSCVKILVRKSNQKITQALPTVEGTPSSVTTTSSRSLSRLSKSRTNRSISKSIQTIDNLSENSIFKSPINQKLRISGLNSSTDSTLSVLSDTLLQTENDCLVTSQNLSYRWRQTEGLTSALKPLTRNCSLVEFTPNEVGIYSFEMVYRVQEANGRVIDSLPKTLTIIANDFSKIGAGNGFIPLVDVGDSIVTKTSTSGGKKKLTLPQAQCFDDDKDTSVNHSAVTTFGLLTKNPSLFKDCSAVNMTCEWVQVSGPAALILTSGNLGCAPNGYFEPGYYEYDVRSFDGEYFSLTDRFTMVISTDNQAPPQASAGFDSSVLLNERVTLNGASSFAQNGNFEYIWSQKAGPIVELYNSRTKSPFFFPDQEGNYKFHLKIKDSFQQQSLPDEVEVFVRRSTSSTQSPAQANNATAAQNVQFEDTGGGGGGGCFVVTATSGSKDSWLVGVFTGFRDSYLIQSNTGRWIMSMYYKYSPPFAGLIRESSILRVISVAVLYPIAFAMSYGQFGFLIFFLLFGMAFFIMNSLVSKFQKK